MSLRDPLHCRGILSDMDGVWFIGDSAIPGAVSALARIRACSLPIRFVTNTTTRLRSELAARMQSMGLDIPADEIIHSPQATVLHLRARGATSCHLMVHDNIRSMFDEFSTASKPDTVVVGEVEGGWNYDQMNEAFRLITEGADLVAMHKGRYWQVADGLTLDIGAFVAGLEYATGKVATVVGKPSATMFEMALADMGVRPEDAVMVGDDVNSDIGGAQAAGVAGVLVKTGKYRDALVASSGVSPTLVVDSIESFAERLQASAGH